ncbi:MAG: hypothetical protein M1498_03385 [Candidatus Thermoplasmatota archaeon]|nr:hypothetical protein [Candidatus Thermoplasmatota archaeon]
MFTPEALEIREEDGNPNPDPEEALSDNALKIGTNTTPVIMMTMIKAVMLPNALAFVYCRKTMNISLYIREEIIFSFL